MRILTMLFFSLACMFAASALQAGNISPVINEFVANHDGTDDFEFVEIFGAPNTDYSGLTIVEIEGDSGTTGLVDDFIEVVGVTDANGFFVAPGPAGGVIENGTMTLLLVSGWTGSIGDDIDTDDDGVIDATFWTSIIDSIGVLDGGATDLAYGQTNLASSFDGGAFSVGGASRIPNGTDTDAVGDWVRNNFNHLNTSPIAGQAANTPGAVNRVVPEPASWLLMVAAAASVAATRRRLAR